MNATLVANFEVSSMDLDIKDCINANVYSQNGGHGISPHQLAEPHKYSPRMIVFEMDAAQLKGGASFRNDAFKDMHLLLKSTITKLQQDEDDSINRIFEELLKKNPNIVSVYVLDDSGKQISKRLAGKADDPFGLRIMPSVAGSDHSGCDFFVYLNSGFEKAAGSCNPDPLCHKKYEYIAGFYYKEGSRRGRIFGFGICLFAGK